MSLYHSPKDAALKLNVSQQTLRRWADKGKISFITTKGGHRRYYFPTTSKSSSKIIYSRVSSRKQTIDMQRQIKILKAKFPEYKLITDIGSGINFERPGFISILEQLFKGDIQEVVVAHKDRFTRFGFKFFSWLFLQFGAKLTVLHESKCSPQQELSEDLIAIITVFTARYYGSRKYKMLQKD